MKHFDETIAALQALDQDQLDRLLFLVRKCTGTIWICGNGGSMSTAQHWACDLSKAVGKRAIALGSNPALLTAWANDVVYGGVFEEELLRFVQAGDLVICLSCSGASENILAALYVTHHKGIASALITGQGQKNVRATALICIPSDDYGVIEDCHLAIGHWLTKELRHGQ